MQFSFHGRWYSYIVNVASLQFRNLKGDSETVSTKSYGNVLENNIQEKCESNFTIRHDSFNTIRNNMCTGSHDITVSGDSNAIAEMHMIAQWIMRIISAEHYLRKYDCTLITSTIG